jgi:ParB-like chromosome segregation protein Spo0J
MHNIVVCEADDQGVYEIISGERRYRAFQLLAQDDPEKYSTVPCKVEVKIDNDFAEFLLLQANAMARDLTDYEKAYQGLRMKAILSAIKKNGQLDALREKGLLAKGRMRDAIAHMFDVSRGQVSRWESIFINLSKDFLLEFKAEKIGIAIAYDISLLDQAVQSNLFNEYQTGGIEAVKDAMTGITKAETSVLTMHVPMGDEAFQEVAKALAQKVNVQKQDHQQLPVDGTGQSRAKTSVAKPLIGTDAQYQSLLRLGLEAKVSMGYSVGTTDRTKYSDRLEAFCLVADEFGFGRKRYIDDIDKMIQNMKMSS